MNVLVGNPSDSVQGRGAPPIGTAVQAVSLHCSDRTRPRVVCGVLSLRQQAQVQDPHHGEHLTAGRTFRHRIQASLTSCASRAASISARQ